MVMYGAKERSDKLVMYSKREELDIVGYVWS